MLWRWPAAYEDSESESVDGSLIRGISASGTASPMFALPGSLTGKYKLYVNLKHRRVGATPGPGRGRLGETASAPQRC